MLNVVFSLRKSVQWRRLARLVFPNALGSRIRQSGLQRPEGLEARGTSSGHRNRYRKAAAVFPRRPVGRGTIFSLCRRRLRFSSSGDVVNLCRLTVVE